MSIKDMITASLKHPMIQIALVTGASIIIMAWFSKKVLPVRIRYLPMAIPPFIGTVYESLYERYGDRRWMDPIFWIVAILLATEVVILGYALQ